MGSDFNVENRPTTFPLLKIDNFWRHFSTDASIFNVRMVLFFNKFQLKIDRAGHFSTGVYFQRYTGVFGVSVTATLTLYVIIFVNIVVKHKRRRQLFEETSNRSKNTMELNDRNYEGPHSEVVSCVRWPIFVSDVKLGVKLFALSLVFIVVYLPAYLMKEEIIDPNLILFYMYFSYNVLHPFT